MLEKIEELEVIDKIETAKKEKMSGTLRDDIKIGSGNIKKNRKQPSDPVKRMDPNAELLPEWNLIFHIIACITQTISKFFRLWSILLLAVIMTFCAGFLFLHNLYDTCRQQEYEVLSHITNNSFSNLMNTVIYDVNGNELATLHASDYKYTKISDISDKIQEAYIAVEDKNFKTHIGIDPVAILRASYQNIKNNKVTQGGSTITQQMIKNTLLTQDQTLARKLTEAFLAIDIEKKFTKADIMEFYLNTNYYGNGCYGVYSACQFYFDCAPDEVSWDEAAMLAAISNSPNNYNPVANDTLAITKRNSILEILKETGLISEKELQTSREKLYKIDVAQSQAEKESYLASFAIYCATLNVMEQEGFQFRYTFKDKNDYESYKESYHKMYSETVASIRAGGYEIFTTLDPDLQEDLQNSLDKKLMSVSSDKQENGKYNLQGAAVCVENETGYIVAAVGGRGTEDEYNRAFLATRQPGSTIKPVIDYGPAFDTGNYYPSYIMKDEPIENGPKNSGKSYAGNVSLRTAIRKSINTVAYRLFMNIGIDYGISYLEKLKFSGLSYIDNENASLSIGGFTNGVKVWEMAKAYATIENNGIYTDRTCILKIKTANGEHDYADQDQSHIAYQESSAYMLTSCMQDVIADGTGKGLSVSGQACAGKTGTTNNYRDGWFCGYTPYYTTAVWVGNDDNSVVKNNYGADYAGSIWKEFMNSIHKDLKSKTFPIPLSVNTRNINAYGGPVDYPTGKTDLFDATNELTAYEKARETQIKDENSNAEKAVSEYESLYIESEEDCYYAQTYFDLAQAAVAGCSDDESRNKFLERIYSHKTYIDAELDKWNYSQSMREVFEQTLQEENTYEQQLQNEQTKQIKIMEAKITRFTLQISRIQQLKYQSQTAYDMLALAQTYLLDLSDCDEYENYQLQYDEACAYVSDLPAKSMQNRGNETDLSEESDAAINSQETAQEEWNIW